MNSLDLSAYNFFKVGSKNLVVKTVQSSAREFVKSEKQFEKFHNDDVVLKRTV